ncbi:MAG TPA: hypothetical protein VFP95_06475 [Gammaproteobacteria bacterium]|nr:hypothetical protein [Gammaproteobacteria bacterium]
MSNDLQEYSDSLPVSPEAIRDQVNLIQRMMKDVMKPDVHYGVIPGTDKPTLYKSGAEKICLLFRFSTRFRVESVSLPDGHREYSVYCTLVSPSGIEVGQGIGVCTTMESKYRYRWDNTNQPVPSEYWETRDKAILGGDMFVPRKQRGTWLIFQRVAHDNPADYYNTCAKMAKKRAHTDATLTSTAASDIFEQDIEEMEENGAPVNSPAPARGKPATKAPRSRSSAKDQGNDDTINEQQAKLVRKQLENASLPESDLCHSFEIDCVESLNMGRINDAFDWIKENAA